jgi:hypothetical protein
MYPIKIFFFKTLKQDFNLPYNNCILGNKSGGGVITINWDGLPLKYFLDTNLDLHDTHFIQIFFQLLYGLYILNIQLCIIHYDLHFGNITVKELSTEQDIYFEYKGQIYTYKTKYITAIYDFDLSFCTKLDNETMFSDLSFSNLHTFHMSKFNENKNFYDIIYIDIAYILLRLKMKYTKIYDLIIINVLENDKEIIDILDSIFNDIKDIRKSSPFFHMCTNDTTYIKCQCLKHYNILDKFITYLSLENSDNERKYLKYKKKYINLKYRKNI